MSHLHSANNLSQGPAVVHLKDKSYIDVSEAKRAEHAASWPGKGRQTAADA